jgi:hypothetical protein
MNSNTFHKKTLKSIINEKKELNFSDDPSLFFKKIINENKKTGVRITNNNNEYKKNPFDYDVLDKSEKTFNQISNNSNCTFFDKLDLNINNYSREDLFNLFGVESDYLTEDIMKKCKKIANNTHPDKSKLNEKYFIFFSIAFKKLMNIYNFSNKLIAKQLEDNNIIDYDVLKEPILHNILEKKANKKFDNKLFNEEFEKNRIDDHVEIGYDTWLKSDEDIFFTPHNINKDQMTTEINKYKNKLKTVVKYDGIQCANSSYSEYSEYSVIERDNFTSNGLFNNNLTYTDLKQAYTESVIPITEEDYDKLPKFKNVDEYKDYRNNKINVIEPIDIESSIKKLYFEKEDNEETNSLAYYYASKTENINKKNGMVYKI